MLETLQNYSPKEKERVLSQLALTLMPDPGIKPGPITSSNDDIIFQKVLQEIQPGETQNISQLFEIISKEISNATLSNVNQSQIKARLGQKGLLRSTLYAIEMSKSFRKFTVLFGIRPVHVENALRNPDAVHHLSPGEFGQSISKSEFSLYLQTPQVKDQSNAYSLLVMSKRDNAVQKVTGAWRVFHSDVDISDSHGPLDVWRAFAEKYGLPIKVGDISGKFILYKKIYFKGSKVEMIQAQIGGHRRILQHLLLHKGDGFLEIAYAFMLDVDRYASDLQRHGINVELETFPKGAGLIKS